MMGTEFTKNEEPGDWTNVRDDPMTAVTAAAGCVAGLGKGERAIVLEANTMAVAEDAREMG